MWKRISWGVALPVWLLGAAFVWFFLYKPDLSDHEDDIVLAALLCQCWQITVATFFLMLGNSLGRCMFEIQEKRHTAIANGACDKIPSDISALGLAVMLVWCATKTLVLGPLLAFLIWSLNINFYPRYEQSFQATNGGQHCMWR
jgi:hypothetical protein